MMATLIERKFGSALTRYLRSEVDEDNWNRLWAHLSWRYGVDRALRIMAGEDAEAAADLERWRRFGSRP